MRQMVNALSLSSSVTADPSTCPDQRRSTAKGAPQIGRSTDRKEDTSAHGEPTAFALAHTASHHLFEKANEEAPGWREMAPDAGLDGWVDHIEHQLATKEEERERERETKGRP